MMPHTDDAPITAGRRAVRATPPPAPRRLTLGPRSEGSRPRRRRDRRHRGLRARRRRPRGRRPRPPARAGARDELCQCRRGLARLLGAVGRPGRAAEGDQVAGDAPPAARHPAEHRLVDDPLVARHAAQLHRGALPRSTRRAWFAWPNTAATACAPCARRPGSPTTSERAARCSSFAPRSSSTAAPATSPCCARAASPSSCSIAPAAFATSPRSRACRRSSSAACSCPATRPATAIGSRSASPSWRAQRGVDFRFETTIRTIGRSGDRITGVTTDSGVVDCRRLPGRARQLFAVAARADRRAHPGLSGQGLLDHRADQRRRRRARVDGDGRDAQGRGHAPRRPHPRRRHRRARRLHAAPARRAPQDAGARRQRSLPRRRRHQPRRVLVRPQADDARRHAGDRRDADRQPLPRHRPRHARLDDGGRHRRG